MNLEKFTDRAKGFLQSAQTVAIRMSHQRIGPEHLLKALLEDEQGMASGLIKAAGGDAPTALRETDAALVRIERLHAGCLTLGLHSAAVALKELVANSPTSEAAHAVLADTVRAVMHQKGLLGA